MTGQRNIVPASENGTGINRQSNTIASESGQHNRADEGRPGFIATMTAASNKFITNHLNAAAQKMTSKDRSENDQPNTEAPVSDPHAGQEGRKKKTGTSRSSRAAKKPDPKNKIGNEHPTLLSIILPKSKAGAERASCTALGTNSTAKIQSTDNLAPPVVPEHQTRETNRPSVISPAVEATCHKVEIKSPDNLAAPGALDNQTRETTQSSTIALGGATNDIDKIESLHDLAAQEVIEHQTHETNQSSIMAEIESPNNIAAQVVLEHQTHEANQSDITAESEISKYPATQVILEHQTHENNQSNMIAPVVVPENRTETGQSKTIVLRETLPEKTKVVDPREVYILTMGLGGVGKSSFILAATGDQTVSIDHSLEGSSNSKKISTYTTIIQSSEAATPITYHIIDTPGFDDPNQTETEIFIHMVSFLCKLAREHKKIGGILFFHRISDERMTGASKRALELFKALCGPEAMRLVSIVTTHWDITEPLRTGEDRETQLITNANYWADMINKGARTRRYQRTAESARHILSAYGPSKSAEKLGKHDACVMHIQWEIIAERKELPDTAAGRVLLSRWFSRAADEPTVQRETHLAQEAKPALLKDDDATRETDKKVGVSKMLTEVMHNVRGAR